MKTITVLIFLCAAYANGQTTAEFEDRLYNTYVEGKVTLWKDIIQEMQAEYKVNKEKDLLYSLCFAQYGYIGYCISKDMEKEAKASLKAAMKNTKELEELYHSRHDVMALQGSLIGLKIMLSKFSALYLGPKAFKLINTASASSHKYYNCSLEIGNMRYFTPKFLGGSKEEAISYYENAVELIEKSIKKGEQNWIYINTVLFLANAYYDTGSKDLACESYVKILQYEHRAIWIRDEMQEKCRD